MIGALRGARSTMLRACLRRHPLETSAGARAGEGRRHCHGPASFGRSYGRNLTAHSASLDLWDAAAAPVELGEREVHVWWVAAPGSPQELERQRPGLLQRYRDLLPPQDLQYAASTDVPAEQVRRTLSRVLTRLVLARCLPRGSVAHPRELVLSPNAHGKPQLQTAQSQAGEALHAGTLLLYHNSTHTPGLVGCAVSRMWPVGLDVELASRRPSRLAALAARRLSAEERDALLALEGDPERQAALFARLWTLKEAFVKARGTGIGATPGGLRGFSVGIQQAAADDSSSPAAALHQRLSSVAPDLRPLMPPSAVTFTSPHYAAGPQPKFLLFMPSASHVAALCIDTQGAEQQTLAAPKQPRPLDGDGLRVKMWGCLPLVSQQLLQPTDPATARCGNSRLSRLDSATRSSRDLDNSATPLPLGPAAGAIQ